jgi:hypothetical protein
MKMKHDVAFRLIAALKPSDRSLAPVWRAAFGGEGAAKNVPHQEFFDILWLHAGPLHRRFAELGCRDIGQSAAKAAERCPDAAGELDSLSVALSPRVFVLAQVVTSWPGRNDPRVLATKR